MKAYTVNNHLVGVGNDQILGTDQGGGGGVEYEAGQYISIDENNVISVTGISAGDGTLSIIQNVTGAPLEITYPTDVAPDAVFYQINSVTGNAYSTSTSYAVINYYYGETPADFNGSDDSILFTINDNISNIGAIYFYYTQSETAMGGPSLTTTSINGGSTGIVQSGTYKLKAQYNQAGTSSPYGTYLQIMFNWKNYASDSAQSLQWAQEALPKITFFGVARPDPSLGVTVNLDRYYLGGNIVSYKPTNLGLPAQIWLNPATKKQEVYLPNTVPASWNLKTTIFFQYGGSFGYNNADSSHDYIAYKYDSTTRNYEFAELVHTDPNAKKFTFARTYNGAIEYWIADCTNDYYSPVWTTETSEYIIDGDLELNGDSEVTAINGHAIASESFEQVNSDWNANSGVAEILNKPTEIQLIAGANVQVEVTGASAIISAQGGGGHEYTAGPGIEIENYEISTTELASGLQLVAGKGVTLTVSGTNIIAGIDETVLYTATSASNSITTSEEVTHFERLRIELQSAQSTYVKNCLECKPDASNLVYTGTALIPAAVYPLQLAGVRYTSSNAKNFTFSSATRMCYKVNGTYGDMNSTNFASSDLKDVGFITKIVGINRISS